MNTSNFGVKFRLVINPSILFCLDCQRNYYLQFFFKINTGESEKNSQLLFVMAGEELETGDYMATSSDVAASEKRLLFYFYVVGGACLVRIYNFL